MAAGGSARTERNRSFDPPEAAAGRGRKVLVCGGRKYRDQEHVFMVLDWVHATFGINFLVEGAAWGADELAYKWRRSRGVPGRRVPVTKQEWDTLGKKAGNLRNQKMLDEEKPDLVIAFPGGTETADMARRADKAEVEVFYA